MSADLPCTSGTSQQEYLATFFSLYHTGGEVVLSNSSTQMDDMQSERLFA
jgi:hypothetical protein